MNETARIESKRLDLEDYFKVFITIFASAVIAHFVVQVINCVFLAAVPQFDNALSMLLNAVYVSIPLTIGWLTRRLFLVTAIFAVLGICIVVFLTSYLRGELRQWLMQINLYVIMPFVGYVAYVAISKLSNVPPRPLKAKPF